MAQTVSVIVSAEDRARLAAIIGDRSRPLKHVQRARIVLHSADRLPALEISRRSGVSRPAVWRWQRHYAEGGRAAAARGKPQAPGKAPVDVETVAKVLALTSADPPAETTHWTGRPMAKAVNLSLRTVRRIWGSTNCNPTVGAPSSAPRIPPSPRRSRISSASTCIPPATPGHAVVLSIDEKSQIQALDRTQPGLPLKPGKCGTMTHDYKRHGTTTLFAAFNVLEGVVLGRCMQRHTHQELIRFLNAVEREVPAGKIIHAILDNYATHKHPKVRDWLVRHPRWVFHFTPTSGSWLNAVENFFSALTRRRLKRGVFKSIVDLQAAIKRYLDEHNADPKPFVWTKPADVILAKVSRLPVPSV